MQGGSNPLKKPLKPPDFPPEMDLTQRFDCVWPRFLMDYSRAQTGKSFPEWTGDFAGFDLKKLYKARAPLHLTCMYDVDTGVMS